jgi:transcriptional regulator of acetoin/glycerol metabolism
MERIRLFPDVANLPLRAPAMIAKQGASLELLSGCTRWRRRSASSAPFEAASARSHLQRGRKIVDRATRDLLNGRPSTGRDAE